MSSLTRPLLTEQEYLTQERGAETKSEYVAGEVFALAGTSVRHNAIAANTLSSLHAQLREGPCRVLMADLRVKASHARLYTYPDILVVCGEPRFEDADLDTLLNPTLIIEVLSPPPKATTAARSSRCTGRSRRWRSTSSSLRITSTSRGMFASRMEAGG